MANTKPRYIENDPNQNRYLYNDPAPEPRTDNSKNEIVQSVNEVGKLMMKRWLDEQRNKKKNKTDTVLGKIP